MTSEERARALTERVAQLLNLPRPYSRQDRENRGAVCQEIAWALSSERAAGIREGERRERERWEELRKQARWAVLMYKPTPSPSRDGVVLLKGATGRAIGPQETEAAIVAMLEILTDVAAALSTGEE